MLQLQSIEDSQVPVDHVESEGSHRSGGKVDRIRIQLSLRYHFMNDLLDTSFFLK